MCYTSEMTSGGHVGKKQTNKQITSPWKTTVSVPSPVSLHHDNGFFLTLTNQFNYSVTFSTAKFNILSLLMPCEPGVFRAPLGFVPNPSNHPKPIDFETIQFSTQGYSLYHRMAVVGCMRNTVWKGNFSLNFNVKGLHKEKTPNDSRNIEKGNDSCGKQSRCADNH